MKKIYELPCVVCGELFRTTFPQKMFCSEQCRMCGSLPMPKPHPGDNFMRTHSCAICGKQYKHLARESKYCPECRERPYRDKWQKAHDAIVGYEDAYHDLSSRRCIECGRSFFSHCSAERVCPACIDEDRRRKLKAMHDPWEPELETYAEYQRRTNPSSMYADGRHLDELVGVRSKGGTHA